MITPFEETTNMEKLERKVSISGAVLAYGDHVLVTHKTFDGFIAAVYEFIETPEETGFRKIECRLNLIEHSEDYFEDGGHAIEWALDKVK